MEIEAAGFSCLIRGVLTFRYTQSCAVLGIKGRCWPLLGGTDEAQRFSQFDQTNRCKIDAVASFDELETNPR